MGGNVAVTVAVSMVSRCFLCTAFLQYLSNAVLCAIGMKHWWLCLLDVRCEGSDVSRGRGGGFVAGENAARGREVVGAC